jgi:5-methylcytosine-specific restriction endonuclease McrA
MSQHHRRMKHTTHAPRVREMLAARLPLPCIECGQPVTAEQAWHVAHIVPASQGGQTNVNNCGAAHARCNLRSGGKLGAAVVNTRRVVQLGRRKWV